MKNANILNRVNKKITAPAPDLSKREAYDAFCLRYGENVRPGLETVDKLQAKSMAKAFTKVVR